MSFGQRILAVILLGIGLATNRTTEAAVPLDANLPMSPRTKGYRLVEAFPGLPSVYATKLYSAPGDSNRLFAVGKGGLITVITNLAFPTASAFLDLSAKTFTQTESGLLGLAFHPGWRTNRQFFVYFSTLAPHGGTNALHQQVVRYLTDPNNLNRALPDTETVLLSQLDPEAGHQAGDLQFGPDGYLYVAVGDGGGAWDTFHNSQKIDGGFFSGILRLDVDSRPENLEPNPHPGINADAYRIPADNPYVGTNQFLGRSLPPETVRTEFWAVGLRNPFRMAFHPETGVLFANDTGQNRREEINRIVPGANYGWVFFEGSLLWPFGVPAGAEFTPPVFEYEHEQGKVAITAAHWYVGDRYPDLRNTYIFADLGGPIGALSAEASSPRSANWFVRQPGIVDIITDPSSGELLFSSINDGRIYRLEAFESGSDPIPDRLSQTRLFADLENLSPAPGLVPYSLNHPFWSDAAFKTRWFGLLPGTAPLQFAPTAPWVSSAGTVWVKHFELETGGAHRRRLETRVLVRNSAGVWGATYRWKEDGTDAILVPEEGLEESMAISGQPDGTIIRNQRWRYPSRQECLGCHLPVAGFALGFNTAQLNLCIGPDHQLRKFADSGYLVGLPNSTGHLPRLVPLDDPQASVSHRVRSYLDANCAYCHQPGGPTRAQWDGRISTQLTDAGIVGVPALNNLGDVYGITPTQIVFPDKPDQSAIFRRIADLEPYHMPPLGTTVVHTNAVGLVEKWISGPAADLVPFAEWQRQRFGETNSPASQRGADPDADGLANESEWLLGENPQSSDRHWHLGVATEAGSLTFRFERRPDLIMQLETGNPFGNAPWTLVETDGNEFFSPQEPASAEIRLPLSAVENRFFRLRISRL